MILLTKDELQTYLLNHYSKVFMFPEIPIISFNIAPKEIDIHVDRIKEYFTFCIRNYYQYMYIESEDKYLIDDLFFNDADPIIFLSKNDFFDYLRNINDTDCLEVSEKMDIHNSCIYITVKINVESTNAQKDYIYKNNIHYFYDKSTKLFLVKKSILKIHQ